MVGGSKNYVPENRGGGWNLFAKLANTTLFGVPTPLRHLFLQTLDVSRGDPIGIFMAEMNQFEWGAAVQFPQQSNKYAVCHSQLYFTAMSYQRNTGH